MEFVKNQKSLKVKQYKPIKDIQFLYRELLILIERSICDEDDEMAYET